LNTAHNIIKALLVLAAGLLAGGCTGVAPVASTAAGGLFGQVPAAVNSQTAVNLSEANFVVVKTNVVGRAKGFRLLCIIPITPARLTTAMDRLYAKADIQVGQPKALAHLVTEYSCTYWILFAFPEVTVRADVVQFNPRTEPRGDAKKEPDQKSGAGN
jgi:hypothetical protein